MALTPWRTTLDSEGKPYRWRIEEKEKMGCYVDPPDGTDKALWLKDNGDPLGWAPSSLSVLPNDKLPVCLIDNGLFTAAGVAFSDAELAVFDDSSDPRPKLWFSVPRVLLREVSPLKYYE